MIQRRELSNTDAQWKTDLQDGIIMVTDPSGPTHFSCVRPSADYSNSLFLEGFCTPYA